MESDASVETMEKKAAENIKQMQLSKQAALVKASFNQKSSLQSENIVYFISEIMKGLITYVKSARKDLEINIVCSSTFRQYTMVKKILQVKSARESSTKEKSTMSSKIANVVIAARKKSYTVKLYTSIVINKSVQLHRGARSRSLWQVWQRELRRTCSLYTAHRRFSLPAKTLFHSHLNLIDYTLRGRVLHGAFETNMWHFTSTLPVTVPRSAAGLSQNTKFVNRLSETQNMSKGLSSSLYNYRRLNVPTMPENLHELAERVGQYAPIQKMYIGHCEDTNGGIALMFMHPDMREPLKECTALFGDGTFKALRRYWYWKCRIPDEFHNILEYAMSLPYLPAENMEAGFNVVMGLMSYHNVPNADRFNTYFRRQWLPLANVVSVYGRRIRTNNICENFHLHAKTFIGVRQGLWLMLGRGRGRGSSGGEQEALEEEQRRKRRKQRSMQQEEEEPEAGESRKSGTGERGARGRVERCKRSSERWLLIIMQQLMNLLPKIIQRYRKRSVGELPVQDVNCCSG
ncbi:unnamed protein product, partial [Trichogramma brassicae]